MPYVGGAASRMSDCFMRLMGFIAIGRVLRRHGVSLPVIGDIERETYKAQLRTVPEAERLASGRQFMSPENQTWLREQAVKSHAEEFPKDFVYDFVEPGPGGNFEFGTNYKACGLCKFAARHGDKEILPSICGLDFEAYATRGIRLERTQTLAGGAGPCNSGSRVSSLSKIPVALERIGVLRSQWAVSLYRFAGRPRAPHLAGPGRSTSGSFGDLAAGDL
jgi:hypothetical protein